jgi:hypothetical protein
MTIAERIQALEAEAALSQKRLAAIDSLLLRTVEANNITANTVRILADKVNQLVDALLNRGSNGGKR